MSIQKLAIGCDHAGYEMKEFLKKELSAKGYDVQDFGTHSIESVDYPDYVHPLAESIGKKENDAGILICGSANGVAITANKHAHIRAALVWRNDVSALARQHNDANILVIGARLVGEETARDCLLNFLNTQFEGALFSQAHDGIHIGMLLALGRALKN